MPFFKPAKIDQILAANGRPTTDEQRDEQRASRIAYEKEQEEESKKFYEHFGVYMNSKKRKLYKKQMEKAGRDIYGKPLNIED